MKKTNKYSAPVAEREYGNAGAQIPHLQRPETIQELCDYIAQGGNLAEYCRQHAITYTTTMHWMLAVPSRFEAYERARENRADVLFDEIVGIADETEVKARYDDQDVILALDATAVARNRLRMDARKWAASKLKPKVYGDKVTNEHTGAGGGAIQIAALDMKGLTDDELATMRALMLKANGGAGV